jgi:hypothetical protein
MILNSVRQHNHFITQGNYKATCFDYRLVIFRTILSIVSQDAMHTLGSHRVYIRRIHRIKLFVSKGVTCKLFLSLPQTNFYLNFFTLTKNSHFCQCLWVSTLIVPLCFVLLLLKCRHNPTIILLSLTAVQILSTYI